MKRFEILFSFIYRISPCERELDLNIKCGSSDKSNIMPRLILLLLLCGLFGLVVTNVNLSKRSKVITTGEIPCVAIELGKKCHIAKSTKPISVTIDIGVNVEKVSFTVKGTE